MKKLRMRRGAWVVMKSNEYSNCDITLVYQWTRVNGEEIDEMGIIVIQPKIPIDMHPFTQTIKLSELTFIAFR